MTAKGNFSLIYTGMYTLHDTAAEYWHDTVHYRENKQNICCSVGTACDLGIVFDPPIRHCHCQSGTCLSVSLPYWQLIWNPFIRRALQWQLSITDTDNRQLKRHRSSERVEQIWGAGTTLVHFDLFICYSEKYKWVEVLQYEDKRNFW